MTCQSKRSRPWRQMVVLAVLAMMTASCSTTQSSTGVDVSATAERSIATDDPDLPPTSRARLPNGVIGQVACSDDGACAEEFKLNGRTYAASCGLIDPAQVDLDNELGQGRAFGRETQANALRLDPSLAVIAISAPLGTGCRENPAPDAPTSAWRFAFAGTADDSIVCEVGLFTPDEITDHGCDQ